MSVADTKRVVVCTIHRLSSLSSQVIPPRRTRNPDRFSAIIPRSVHRSDPCQQPDNLGLRSPRKSPLRRKRLAGSYAARSCSGDVKNLLVRRRQTMESIGEKVVPTQYRTPVDDGCPIHVDETAAARLISNPEINVLRAVERSTLSCSTPLHKTAHTICSAHSLTRGSGRDPKRILYFTISTISSSSSPSVTPVFPSRASVLCLR